MTPEELHSRLSRISSSTVLCDYSLEACARMVPLIDEIQELKRKRNAVILAHSYVAPEIVHAVADYSGDSYQLSLDASKADCETIVFVAVRFMGETAKLLNPERTVLVPGRNTGCTLADSINGEQVRALRRQYPDSAFVCYINTTAEVKAECDVCVTSSNVVDICAALPQKDIVFLPDRLMAENLRAELTSRGVQKNIVSTSGCCYVHEQYDPELIEFFRMQNPGLQVIAHPECRPEVALQSDYVGSTSQMLRWIGKSTARDFLLLTECGLSAKLQADYPEKHFVGSCSMCRYMKSNSLEDILRVLRNPSPDDIIEIDPATASRARVCVNAMFRYTGQAQTRPLAGGCD